MINNQYLDNILFLSIYFYIHNIYIYIYIVIFIYIFIYNLNYNKIQIILSSTKKINMYNRQDIQQTSFDYNQDSFQQPQIHNQQNHYKKVPIPIDNYQYYHQYNLNKQHVYGINRQQTNNAGNKNNKNNKMGNDKQINYQLTFKKDIEKNNKINISNLQNVRNRLFHGAVQNPQTNTNNKIRNKGKDKGQNTYVITQSDKIKQQILAIIKSQTNINNLIPELRAINPPVSSTIIQSQTFALISNPQLPNYIHQRLSYILQIYNIKNLRKKRNSVKLNIQIIKNNRQHNIKQFSQIDRKRLELLQRLEIQLEKKIFIENLRYGKIRKICVENWQYIQGSQQNVLGKYTQRQYQGQYSINQQEYTQNQFIPKANKQRQQQKDSPLRTSHNHNNNSPSNQKIMYYNQNKIKIFIHSLSSVLNKNIYFPIFRMLYNNQGLYGKQEYQQRQRYSRNNYEIKYQNFEEQQQNDHKYQDQEQQQNDNEGQINENENNPIQAIQLYIKQLKNQLKKYPKQRKQIMKNYFICWKIFFLTTIIQRMERQQLSQQHQHQQNQSYYKQQIPLYQQKPNHYINKNIKNLQSQYTSNNSIENDLKHQKSQLKQFLRVKQILRFFNLFRENKANRGIKQITKAYYERNLLKKAFYIFSENHNKIQLDKYLQYICENQDLSQQTTAKIYYKTNNVAKTFFGLKNYTRCSRFITKIDKFIIRYHYNKIKSNFNSQKQAETKLNKFLQRRRKQILFKYYCVIRNQTSFSNQIQNRIQLFQNRRQNQIKDICFSVINLEYKKKLALQKRVQKLTLRNDVKRLFKHMKSELNKRANQLRLNMAASFTINYLQKQIFFEQLTKIYKQKQIEKRIQIKAAKIQIERSKDIVKKGLRQWRRLCICHKNYQVIEQKLKRVKQMQQKQRLLRIWHERLMEKFREKRKDKLTSDHKLWLNKYYQKLCAIEQQQYN